MSGSDELLPFFQRVNPGARVPFSLLWQLPSKDVFHRLLKCVTGLEHAAVKERFRAGVRTHVLRARMREPEDGW